MALMMQPPAAHLFTRGALSVLLPSRPAVPLSSRAVAQPLYEPGINWELGPLGYRVYFAVAEDGEILPHRWPGMTPEQTDRVIAALFDALEQRELQSAPCPARPPLRLLRD